MNNDDTKYMQLALQLAKQGYGATSPNPMVGAVLVKHGKIIGRGYHHFAGGDHAEIIAINQAGTKAKGATLYITLEPCCHYGKTPPCTDRIVQAGVKKVVVAVRDPNPLVRGKGIRQLQDAGVDVVVGIKQNEAEKLNKAFFKFIQTRIPFGILKLAMSLDGKIATRTGESRWITDEKSREYVHYLRAGVDAVLVGANTVLHDNPLLTVRLPNKVRKQPIRVIVDSQSRIPLSAQVFKKTARNEVNTILATTKQAPLNRRQALTDAGVTVWVLPQMKNGVAIRRLFRRLGEHQVQSVLIEGGAEVAWSCLNAEVVDKIVFMVAPKIIGGKAAPGAIGGIGISKLSQAISLKDVAVEKLGNDLKIEAYISKSKIQINHQILKD